MYNPNCRDSAYTVADFEKLQRGSVVTLHYNDTNKGTFTWVHSHVEDDRVHGQFAYDGDQLSGLGDYLYEFQGFVCRGSGAEPVCREMPDDCPDNWMDDDDDYEEDEHGFHLILAQK